MTENNVKNNSETGIQIYESLSRPPETALKKITGGRLSGKTDINPQWRIRALTEKFGLCGVGWKYKIDKLWTEQGANGEVFAFSMISLYVKQGDDWTEPIPGIGGNMLIEKENKGLHCNDEAFKMATTDALSVAGKAIGLAASIYAGEHDKYGNQGNGNNQNDNKNNGNGKAQNKPQGKQQSSPSVDLMKMKTDKLSEDARKYFKSLKYTLPEVFEFCKKHSFDNTKIDAAIKAL